MIALLKTIFSAGSVVGDVAKEIIDTPLEKAQAQVLKLKAMDPNGKMRLRVTEFTCRAYGFYLITTVILIFMSVWEVGGSVCTVADGIEACKSRADIAAGRMTDLFFPITGAWTTIVGASFGVNYKNSAMGK